MQRTTTTIAAALATLAVAAPVAAARPIEPGYVAAPKLVPVTQGTPVVRTVVVHQTGFDWLDAAIGAAVAAGLLSLTGAGVLVVRRPREDASPALGAH
jgi:hypothetical protein